MDQTQALQNLLNGTASEEEINLLKGGLASGEISIGGNVNQSVIIIGSGNTVELPPAALDRLGGRSLLGDLDRDLTGEEIVVGLNRLEAELPQRAPVLLTQFQEQTRRLHPSLKTNPKSISDHARRERIEALAQVNSLCMEALDISFNALCLGEEPPEYDSRSPFRGLESFRPEDNEFFFGREVLTKKLVAKNQSYPFLAVLGASGSGKSSLVMAGLIPAFGSEYVIFRPGTNPLEALDAVKENALVVVDQFEELFTLTRDEAIRKEFIAKLLETSKQNKVVITLRSDFLGEVAAHRNLNEEVQNHLENVPPMDMDELRRAMEGQADVVGLRFEADLSQQILDDVEGEPGAMPLLQHALWELWNRRHGRNLRASEYRAFGGVKQAITSTAEKVYGECAKEEKEQIRDIFLRLTRLDDSDEGRDTRRRVAMNDLITSGRDTDSTTLLLDKLANARLIVKTVNEDKTEIEVAHEALIRHWERLRSWLNENRDNLRLREGIIDAAMRWEISGRNESLLLHRAGRLDDAVSLSKDLRYGLTNTEQGYLRECVAYQKQEQNRREHLRKQITTGLGIGFTVVLAVAVLAILQWQRAEQQTNIALARQLSAQAQSLFAIGNSKPETAMLLAVQSMRLLPGGEVAQVLQNNTLAHPIARMTHDGAISSLAFSSDGKYVVSGSSDGSARVWGANTGKEIARMIHGDFVSSVAFSPDGKYVASGSGDNTARVWEASTGQEIARMTHDDSVYSVVFSPDSKYIVSGSSDRTARVWEANTGNEIARMIHNNLVTSVAFSSDGKYLVSSGGSDIHVWEAATGKEIARTTHDFWVNSVAFSPDGKYIASGSGDNTARVWEASTGKEIARMTHDDSVYSVVFSPDGKYVVSGSNDGTARVWEASTGKETARMTHDDLVYSVAFSPDGKYVVSGSGDPYEKRDGIARVWETSTGKEIARITHDYSVSSVAFSPDGKYVVSGSNDGTARVWEANAENEIAHMTHDGTVWSVAFSPDSKYVVSGSDDGTARVWEVSIGNEIARMTHGDFVYSVAFSPDGKYIVSGGCDHWHPNGSSCTYNTARVWEASTGKEIARMIYDDWVFSVAFSPDGKYVVSSGGWDVHVWEVATGKEIARMTHDGLVNFVAFCPDGRYVVSGSYDNTARVWEVSTGKEIARMTHDDSVPSVVFSPDGRYVVSGSWDGTARVWEASTGNEIARMTHGDLVESVVFSPNGKYVVSGSRDNTARVWEASTGNEIARMRHDDFVESVSFSPDGRYVVSGSNDGTARVWEASTGNEIAHMRHDDFVESVSFSPDGRYGVSGSNDGTTRVWIYRPEDLIADACSRVTRNLTRDEWEKYIGDALPYLAVCPNLPIEPEPTPTP